MGVLIAFVCIIFFVLMFGGIAISWLPDAIEAWFDTIDMIRERRKRNKKD